MKKFFLLSTQRSGTTWLSDKFNKMLGLDSVPNELCFHEFYKRNNLLDLISMPRSEANKIYGKEMVNIIWIIKIKARDIISQDFCYSPNKDFFKNIYENMTDCFAQPMYDQINGRKNCEDIINPEYIIDYPIIHLVRKNTFSQALSNCIRKKTGNHVSSGKNIKIEVDIEKLKNQCENFFKQKTEMINHLKGNQNVLTLYFEDIINQDFWSDSFVEKLENFIETKFKYPDFFPKAPLTNKSYEIINLNNDLKKEMSKKYLIKS